MRQKVLAAAGLLLALLAHGQTSPFMDEKTERALVNETRRSRRLSPRAGRNCAGLPA
jgi:hypothetical protein